MVERFENVDNILRDWALRRIRHIKVLSMYFTDTRSRKKKVKSVTVLENDAEKKYSSSLSRQSSETKLIKHKIGLEITVRQETISLSS